MKRVLPPLFTFLAGLACLHAEPLEERIETLEKRVALLERALEEKAGAPETPPSTPEASEAKVPVAKPSGKDKVQLKPGATLHVYLATEQNYAVPQKANPLATLPDVAATFTLSNYLVKPGIEGFERQHTGVRWHGFMWIEKPGTYRFTGAWASKSTGVAQLYVNSQVVVIAKSTDRGPQVGSLNFEAPGMYDVEVWVAPSRAIATKHNKAQGNFQICGPGEDEFKPITPGLLFSLK